MRILAIESSELVAGVAVIEDDVLLGEYTTNNKKTHSQTLLPMLDELKKRLELDLETIDAIAVSGGPGSFTGLRIGSATAKGLALALNKPIIHVPTLQALAYNLWGTETLICPMMDARRNQVYTGVFEFVDGEMKSVVPQCVISIEELISKVNDLERKIIFLGTGADVYKKELNESIRESFSFAPASKNRPCAASVALVGKTYYEQSNVQTAREHKPDYMRLSQAERERREKERNYQIC